MIEVMALGILKEVSENIQNAKFFTIMADETADVANKEQVVICFRWVDDDLNVHEDFVGMEPVGRATADKVIAVIKKAIKLMNLKLCNARGQCYDGVSVMSGAKAGVAKQIKDIIKKCLYTHCYGHSLNLAVKDACDVSCLKDTFEYASEICKLVKNSPQRDTHLKEIWLETENENAGLHAFCKTRWTVRGSTLKSIVDNHNELMELWDWSLSILKDTEMKVRVKGAHATMKKFSFFFGAMLGIRILGQTDNLSKCLQQKTLSTAEGQESAKTVVAALKRERNDPSYKLFYDSVLEQMQALDVDEPELPRKRKGPARYDSSEPFYPNSCKEMYKQIYFEAYDYTINGIEKRFNQTTKCML